MTAETNVLANSCSIIAAGLPIASWGRGRGRGRGRETILVTVSLHT